MQTNQLNDQEYLNEVLQQIDDHIAGLRLDRALKLALETLQRLPNDSDAHAACAYCYIALRKFKNARKHINLALELGPNRRLAHLMHIKWYIRKNKFEEAERLLLDLCQRDHTLHSQIELFNLYKTMYSVMRYRIRRYGLLREIKEKLLTTTDIIATQFNAPLYAAKLRAEFFMYVKDDKLAHQAAEECISTDPTDPWGYFVKSYLYLSDYKPSVAKGFLHQGLRLQPDDDWGLQQLALIKAKIVGEYRNRFTRYFFQVGYILILIPILVLFIVAGMPPLLASGLCYGLGFIWERVRVNKARKALATLELKKDF